MAVLLAAGINATQQRVTLTEALEAEPGDLLRIGDEVVEFGGYGFADVQRRLVDHTNKVISIQRGMSGTTAVAHLANAPILRVADGLVSGATSPDPFVSGGGGSGLPPQWTDGGNGDVTATVDDPLKTPLLIRQADDPSFGPGAPALIVRASGDVGAVAGQFKDGNDVVRIDFDPNGGRLRIYDAVGGDPVTLSQGSGLQTGSVNINRTAGVYATPTDTGSDGLYIDGQNLVPADGGAMARFINPVGDMPDEFYGGNADGDLTINADMSNGAAFLLLKGATINGTIVAARIPMIPGSYDVPTTGATPATDPGDIADPTLATAEDVALKLNALMGAMRTAGLLA